MDNPTRGRFRTNFDLVFNTIDKKCKKLDFLKVRDQDYCDITLDAVIGSLGSKINENLRAALKLLLLKEVYLSPSIILIRSAYETLIYQMYLFHQNEEKDNFLCWQDIKRYRKYKQWPQFFKPENDDSPEELKNYEEIKEIALVDRLFIERQLENKRNNIHLFFKKELKSDSNSDLSFYNKNLYQIKKSLIDIIENDTNHPDSISKFKLKILENMIFFQLYKHGSNHVHVNLNTMTDYAINTTPKEYSISNCLSALRMISENNLLNLEKTNSIESDVYDSLSVINKLINEVHSKGF